MTVAVMKRFSKKDKMKLFTSHAFNLQIILRFFFYFFKKRYSLFAGSLFRITSVDL